jgi:hypothetical protein
MRNRGLIVCALVGRAVTATADPCPPDAAARAAAIRAHLDHQAERAHTWDLAWGLGYGAATVAQGAMGATRWEFGRTVTDDIQVGLYIGAGKAAISALSHVIQPLKIARVGLPSSDACADLAAASAALATTAREERKVFWLTAVGTVVLNGGGLLIAGYGYDAWKDGTVGALLGVPVGLATMLTVPRGSLRAWRSGQFEAPSGVSWQLDAVHGHGFTGLIVRGAF